MSTKSRSRCTVNVGRWLSYAAAGAATALAASNDALAGLNYISATLNESLSATHSAIQIKTLTSIGPRNQYSMYSGYLGRPGALVLGTLQHLSAAGHPAVVFKPNPALQCRVVGAVHSGYNYASRLRFLAPIYHGPFLPGGRSDSLAGTYPNSQWNGKGTTGYLGFEFNLGSGEQFGWLRLTNTTGGPADDFNLSDYAEGGLLGTFAGNLPVPEPASLGLLAVGAAGLLAIRAGRRRLSIT